MATKAKRILFLGVGGVSMHQLACAYLSQGFKVFGYDACESEYTQVFIQAGGVFSSQFNKEFLQVDFCVSTGAIKPNNKYVKALNKLGVPIFDRAQILGDMCKHFGCVVAVAGTHGKSTTATLIYEMLKSAGKKVSCHIGADVPNACFCLGDDFLVVEACEYNKSFLSLYPQVSVITNVEAEHMDCYSSMFNLRSAFSTLLRRAKQRFVFSGQSTKFLSKIKDVNFVGMCKNIKLKPKLMGEHNLKNISLAISVAQWLGVSKSLAIAVANSFAGLPRRYQLLGGTNPMVYIDYAHHPTEISAFITAFNQQFENNLIVFQPHTFSRTKMFLKDFVVALALAKNLIIYKEYAARETPSAGLGAFELYRQLKKCGIDCTYVANPKRFAKIIKKWPVVAFVGAGDINKIAKKFAQY